jgi:putative CocE/NonD family hydrolase
MPKKSPCRPCSNISPTANVRDALTHPYFAGHGYAAIRVDMRGNGDSDGVMLDEYAKQEQDDALEVIAWIARQNWSSGKVGMFGISWGGFNALQVAARKPPALKAIVTLCSTDDRARLFVASA